MKTINQPSFVVIEEKGQRIMRVKDLMTDSFTCPDCNRETTRLYQWKTHNWICSSCVYDRNSALIMARGLRDREVISHRFRQNLKRIDMGLRPVILR